MGWPFCPSCHATLSVDSSGAISCAVCGYRSNLSALPCIPTSTTVSSETAVPLWARSDEEQAALGSYQEPVRATVEEPCVKCAAPEVGFYTVQLRSVDEGQTVFYECAQCKHTWSLNNWAPHFLKYKGLIVGAGPLNWWILFPNGCLYPTKREERKLYRSQYALAENATMHAPFWFRPMRSSETIFQAKSQWY